MQFVGREEGELAHPYVGNISPFMGITLGLSFAAFNQWSYPDLIS